MRKYEQSPYPLIKFLLYIKSKDVTGSTDVKFWAKDKKDATVYYSFYLSSEELISIDQSMQMYQARSQGGSIEPPRECPLAPPSIVI